MGYKSLPDGMQFRDREIVLLASAERTQTATTSGQYNPDSRALHVILDVTDGDAGFSITLKIEGHDPASNGFYTLLEGAAVTATGTTVYRIGPGLTAATNSVANDYVPQKWIVTVTPADDKAVTYSVGAVLCG